MSELTLLDVVSSIASSFAGAAGGVLGSQWLTDRSKLRQQLLDDIKSTNTALAIATSVANTSLNAKMQHSKPMVDEWEGQRAAAIAHHRAAGGTPKEPFHFNANLIFIPPIRLPTQSLSRIVFEKISAPTKAVSLAEALERAAQDLNHFIEVRNDLIRKFEQATELDAAAILGLPTPAGTDNRYRDFLKAILSANDDCIYFSAELVLELNKYGEKTRAQLPWRFRGVAPRIVSANFEISKEWMPDPANYESWKRMFVPFPEEAAPPHFSIFRKTKRDD
jgi:hypothetical protein